jgi:Plasmid pRiA4b ORF-3-like protein
VCLTGKRACPPEDCGGIWGYAGFLEAIQDPRHPEHEDMLEWVGGEFDPEAFDLDEVNTALQSLK